MANGPRINDKFPIRESLSPPIVARPVYECAEAVYVSGFVPHARVRVFSNLNDLLAEEDPPFGFAVMTLNRLVTLGESLTATQTVENITSPHSLQPVVVGPLQDAVVSTTKPDVNDELYECGIVVPVGNLVPSVRVHVSEDGTEIGMAAVAQTWHPVLTRALHAGGQVSAQQIACEGSGQEIKGPPADPVAVRPAPVPTPAPAVYEASLIPGSDTVTLTGLLVGAGAEIFDRGAAVSSGWYATAPANYFPVDPPLDAGSVITATQELCGNVSPPSDPATPKGELETPIVLGPICAGARFVVVRETTINATVVVMRNGSIVGYGGAAPGDVVLALGNAVLSAGDVVTALQYMGQTISPTSVPVTVVRGLGQPSVEILGGEAFFLPREGEEPIPGPVFPRGRGSGPIIRIQACCTKGVRLEVYDPKGDKIAEPALNELFPGYFEAAWPWTSSAGWSVPDGIPVGEYMVVVRTGCEQQEARVPFYVIFDPAHVGGSQRFSFDSTAVWFGTGQNTVRGLHYYLHPSDRRVFLIAIQAISGQTDSYSAAVAVSRAEELLFGYSLYYHTNDVVDLIVNYTEAQCADDAACLTALLRAAGIPAHPVTADAGLETGAANWTFDTWVEFLASHAGAIEWRALHPHQYPGMQPESRRTFGTTRGVAVKSFNDVIVMANENWVSAQLDDGMDDVSYGRNECQEPNQHLNKAGWIDELCEVYWDQPHWDCMGVRRYSLESGDGFRFDERPLTFGGRLSGTVHLVNRREDRFFGRLIVELVAHRPESKAFAEIVFNEMSVSVALDPGRSFTLPFDLVLPETMAPGHNLFLRARLDERTAALHEVRIPPCPSCQVTAPERWREGEQTVIRATVRNESDKSLRNVDVDLRVPYALQAQRFTKVRFDQLQPYETRDVAWTVRAVAVLESGSLHVAVASANGGGVLVRRPFTVTGREPKVDGRPGLQPERKRR